MRRKPGRPKGSRDKKKRVVPPHTLLNLIPAKPGQVLNPEGKNGRRPITDEYFLIADTPLPETMRKAINKLLGMDYLPEGITFARSSAVRMFIETVLRGDVHAQTEIREAMEGRATMRVEIASKNARLEALLHEFRKASEAEDPPEIEPPVVQPSPTPES
jgi:hypothetical protein